MLQLLIFIHFLLVYLNKLILFIFHGASRPVHLISHGCLSFAHASPVHSIIIQVFFIFSLPHLSLAFSSRQICLNNDLIITSPSKIVIVQRWIAIIRFESVCKPPRGSLQSRHDNCVTIIISRLLSLPFCNNATWLTTYLFKITKYFNNQQFQIPPLFGQVWDRQTDRPRGRDNCIRLLSVTKWYYYSGYPRSNNPLWYCPRVGKVFPAYLTHAAAMDSAK